jgi:hypothetical protein
MAQQQHFWDVDLGVLLLNWWNDISTFCMTALLFCALSLPVVIPALVMWLMQLTGISFEVRP